MKTEKEKPNRNQMYVFRFLDIVSNLILRHCDSVIKIQFEQQETSLSFIANVRKR